MSPDDRNQSQNPHEPNDIERRLEEIERREFGERWRETWIQSLDRIPLVHRTLVILSVAYPIEVLLLSYFNCPPITYYVAGALTALAMVLSRVGDN
jgi:hypothetical protein